MRSWILELFRTKSQNLRNGRRTRPSLAVEVLEDRTVPATLKPGTILVGENVSTTGTGRILAFDPDSPTSPVTLLTGIAPNDYFTRVAALPDGNVAFVGGYGNHFGAYLFDPETETVQALATDTDSNGESTAEAVTVGPDGKIVVAERFALLTTYAPGRIIAVDPASPATFSVLVQGQLNVREVFPNVFQPVPDSFGNIAVLPDGQFLFSGIYGGTSNTYLYNPATGSVTSDPLPTDTDIFGNSVASDFSASSDGTLYVSEASSQTSIPPPGAPITYTPGRIIAIDPTSPNSATTILAPLTSSDSFRRLATLPDGRITFVGQYGGVVGAYLLDPGTGEVVSLPTDQQFGYSAASSVAVVPVSPDLSPTLKWSTSGGVDVGYTVTDNVPLPSGTTESLYWQDAGGNRTLIPNATVKIPAGTAVGTPTHFDPSVLGTPPVGSKSLVAVVNPGPNGIGHGSLIESDYTNNEKALTYSPSIDSLTATYGTGDGDGFFGRFFSGVSIPDQVYTVRLSQSLAALLPTVVVHIGGKDYAASKVSGGDGQNYQTVAIDPGQYTEDVDLTVQAKVGGAQQGAPKTVTLDMQSLPKWYSLFPNGTATFENGQYHLAGKLVDISPTLPFQIPNSIWLGGGVELQSQLTARAGIDVVAGLDPTADPPPQPSGFLDLQGAFLGQPLFTPIHLSFQNGGGGNGFTASIALDSRSLDIVSGTLTYNPGPQTLPAIPLFTGKIFTIGALQATSALTLTPSFGLDINLTLDTSGHLTAASYVDATLTGTLSGSLTDISLGSSVVTSTLNRALQVAKGLTLAGVIQWAINALTPDLLQLKVQVAPGSNLTLHTRVALGPGGAAPTVNGSVKFGVTGAVYFAPTGTKLLDLPSYFTSLFALDEPF